MSSNNLDNRDNNNNNNNNNSSTSYVVNGGLGVRLYPGGRLLPVVYLHDLPSTYEGRFACNPNHLHDTGIVWPGRSLHAAPGAAVPPPPLCRDFCHDFESIARIIQQEAGKTLKPTSASGVYVTNSYKNHKTKLEEALEQKQLAIQDTQVLLDNAHARQSTKTLQHGSKLKDYNYDCYSHSLKNEQNCVDYPPPYGRRSTTQQHLPTIKPKKIL